MLPAVPARGMCRKAARRARVLGKARSKPDNMGMSDEQQAKGFQFPGVFEIMAAGPAEAHLEEVIPRELAAAGITVLQETVRSHASSAGRFVSVTISFKAETRAEYDAAHTALRAHPDVKWTL